MRARWTRLTWIIFAFGLLPSRGVAQEAAPTPRGWDDERRTMGRYFDNLGYDAPRVFSQPNLFPLLIGASATGAATAFDSETVAYFKRHPDRTLGNVGAQVGGTVSIGLIVGFLAVGRVAPGERFRSFSYDASQSMLISSAYTFALKLSTRRMRPDESNRQSFPSGHASLAFSWASVLGHYYGVAGAIPAYSLASLISISRMAHRSHYLSDIVAGAALGIATGRTVVRGNSRPVAGASEGPVVRKPSVELRLDPGPDSGGSGLAVAVAF